MAGSMDKIIDLVKKTGDTHVIVDQHGEPSYVVLSFKAYERLVDSKAQVEDLSEQELIEKINDQVGNWKEAQEKPLPGNWQSIQNVLKQKPLEADRKAPADITNNTVNQDKKDGTSDEYFFEPVE